MGSSRRSITRPWATRSTWPRGSRAREDVRGHILIGRPPPGPGRSSSGDRPHPRGRPGGARRILSAGRKGRRCPDSAVQAAEAISAP
jgi:hypothetical protein